jgi:hypothetical protein
MDESRDLTYGIVWGKSELESVDLALVKRVLVQDLDVEQPFGQVRRRALRGDELDTRRKAVIVNLVAICQQMYGHVGDAT